MSVIRYLVSLVSPRLPMPVSLDGIDIYSLPRKSKQLKLRYYSSNLLHSFNFQMLFNHRWFFYLEASQLKPVDLTRYIVPMCEAYDHLGINKDKFDNILLLPVDSPRYMALPEDYRASYSHNLITFYDMIYYAVTNYRPSERDFKDLFTRCVAEVNKIPFSID